MSGMPPFLLATLTNELTDYLGAMSRNILPVSLYTQNLVVPLGIIQLLSKRLLQEQGCEVQSNAAASGYLGTHGPSPPLAVPQRVVRAGQST